MEIQEIKQRLTLSQVLHYYHLKPDKQMRLNCPFHDDKTPSMQVYYKTHTAYCFSSNCKTHGKSLDVIDFLMHKENISKAEAINKCKKLIRGNEAETKPPTQIPMEELSRVAVLTKMFTYFKNGVHNSKPAKDYINQRTLDFTKTEIGYNSGQFHHGARKDEALIQSCIKYGLLLDKGHVNNRTGEKAFSPFGKWGIVFPLKNKESQIVSLYFRSTLSPTGGNGKGGSSRHYYLKDRQGLYPQYPKSSTKRLILTESIIDSASLEAQTGIQDKYSVLALFGTNGFTEEHTEAVSQLKELEEIIFFFDGDQAGRSAIAKYAPMLKAEYPKLSISHVATPENEDVNSLLQGHSPAILDHLVSTRKEYDVLFSVAESPEELLFSNEKESPSEDVERLDTQLKVEAVRTGLDTNNPYNLKYQGLAANYQIKGFKINQLDSLKITLQVQAK